MSLPGQMKNLGEADASHKPECRAEFIFYARTQSDETRPVKILGDYTCDFRRPDWEHRWNEWRSRQNPYLNLFLCKDHAAVLGLLDAGGQEVHQGSSPQE